MHSHSKKRPAIAVDVLVFTILKNRLSILLIQRKFDPFQGMYALPGGFMDAGETCTEAALRELFEETAVKGVDLELLGVFSDPHRDPREHVISIAHIGLIRADRAKPQGGDDALAAEWMAFETLPELATDHGAMVQLARKFFEQKRYDYSWFLPLLPDQWTHNDLYAVMEKFFLKSFNKEDFLKSLQSGKAVIDVKIPEGMQVH